MADEDYVKVTSLDKLLPSEMMRVTIGNQEILLVNIDGKVHACSNICPHQFSQLSYGDLEGEEVSCPTGIAVGHPLQGFREHGQWHLGPLHHCAPQ